MREYIHDQQLLFHRIECAQKSMLMAKQLDGRKGGRIINDIWREMKQISSDYYIERERVIFSAQELNIHPSNLPGGMISGQQLSHPVKNDRVERVHNVDTTEYSLSDSELESMYLPTKDILDRLTEGWFMAHGKRYFREAQFYYNDTFIWNVLHFQKAVIDGGNPDQIDYLINAEDRPLIYVYDPNEPVKSSDEATTLLDEWHRYESVYDRRMQELGEEEHRASRGDFWIDRYSPYGSLYYENGQRIYETASIMFWDYVHILYRLSDEHPAYFRKGAASILDGLYGHYKEALFGVEREVSREEFELKATQQYLYYSNDEKQIRVDLFRHIDERNEDSDQIFTGGLFHVFDHFKGLQSSAKSKGSSDLHEERLLYILRDLFFNQLSFKERKADVGEVYLAENDYETPVSFSENGWTSKVKKWKGVFYFDIAKSLFYITSLYIR